MALPEMTVVCRLHAIARRLNAAGCKPYASHMVGISISRLLLEANGDAQWSRSRPTALTDEKAGLHYVSFRLVYVRWLSSVCYEAVTFKGLFPS